MQQNTMPINEEPPEVSCGHTLDMSLMREVVELDLAAMVRNAEGVHGITIPPEHCKAWLEVILDALHADIAKDMARHCLHPAKLNERIAAYARDCVTAYIAQSQAVLQPAAS